MRKGGNLQEKKWTGIRKAEIWKKENGDGRLNEYEWKGIE
jgi:hypothetical protein